MRAWGECRNGGEFGGKMKGGSVASLFLVEIDSKVIN